MGWQHLQSAISWGADCNLLDFTDPFVSVSFSSVFWVGNVHVPPLMRKEVWKSKVEEHKHTLTPLVFHSLLQDDEAFVFIFSQLLKFSECMFWKSWRKITCFFVLAGLHCVFLLFQICYLWTPFSSPHWAQHASVTDLWLAACWWICPHFAHRVCQVKSCKLLLLYRWIWKQ